MTRIKYFCIVLGIITVSISGFVWPFSFLHGSATEGQIHSSSPAILSIQPTTQTVKPGETFSISVSVSGLTNPLTAYQLDLNYPQSSIRLIEVTPGGFLTSTGRTPVCPQPARMTSDTLRIACVTAGKGTGPTGSGSLIDLTFTAVLTGTAEINMSSLQLSGTGVPPISLEATAQGGTVIVSAGLPDTRDIFLPVILKGH